jgi:dihydropteroate synthase
MQQQCQYESLLPDILLWFSKKLEKLRLLGVCDVLIDPGFGFSKTTAQNFEMLGKLREFRILDLPLLVGFSRKSMIYKTLNITPEESLNGTTVLNTIALMQGASVLRVHDVKEAVEAIQLYSETCKKNE